jgi:hypothetical protein
MNITPLQRRVLGFLATVDSATPMDVAREVGTRRTTYRIVDRIIANGHARNISTTRRCVYRITLEGRQAIAPPLVRVKWDGGMSPPLQPSTADALRLRLEGEMGPGTHWVVAA